VDTPISFLVQKVIGHLQTCKFSDQSTPMALSASRWLGQVSLASDTLKRVV